MASPTATARARQLGRPPEHRCAARRHGRPANLIGTTARADGTTQATYGGHPLYYYVGDKAPGDTTGQDIDQFGAKWYVLAKDGNKIDND